jgi:GntR family transcriptional regulator, trigonelline degradation regulator
MTMKKNALSFVEPPQSLRQRVSEAVRHAIEEARFLPGERLIERELCEMTGVSRPLVREVLRELEADGLVTIIPNRGPIVAGPLTAQDALSIYETRAVLEALAGRAFAARATADERSALRATLIELTEAYDAVRSDPAAAIRAKARFYAILYAGAHNSVVPSLLRNLHGRISQLRGLTLREPGRSSASLAELTAIVDAIDARDEEAAALACRTHVENAARVAYALLDAR